jgi:hypothetical protein
MAAAVVVVAIMAMLLERDGTQSQGREMVHAPGVAEDDGCSPELPRVEVSGQDGPLVLEPRFHGGPVPGGSIDCLYGVPTEFPEVGQVDTVRIRVGAPGWSLSASTQEVDGCVRLREAGLRPVDEGWELVPPGPPGQYHVTLYGSGPTGAMSAVFAMTTLRQGPEPPVATEASALFEAHGVIETEDVTLRLENLDDERGGTARVVVTAANGAASSIELTPDYGCVGNGSVRFAAPQTEAQALLDLGPAPFTFRYEVQLQGTTHVAEVVFPDDLDERTTAFHPEFRPVLPAPRRADA